MPEIDTLPFHEYGSEGPALVMMPFLGGGQSEWDGVVRLLASAFRCVTVDLPGFGEATDISGYSVDEMCGALIRTLRSLDAGRSLGRYFLVGHSMAGKVSAVTARRLVEDGSAMHAPAGLVLVAPSPPSPEPMPDSKRDQMLGYFQSPSEAQRDASQFIHENLAEPIPEEIFERATADVLRMNREAWMAWLTHGSKEDWAEFVGVLDIPTIIVAGSQDKALGPAAQTRWTVPHFRNHQLSVVDCSHLIPLERPKELAELIATFAGGVEIKGGLYAEGAA